MHEVGLTQEIVALVSERFPDARLTRIVLEVGKLAAVSVEAIRFCFPTIAEGTPLEGALLDIVEVAGVGRCRACQQRMPLSGR